jgi:hypothetical protein
VHSSLTLMHIFQNFIISSTGENRQFDIVYELDKQRLSVNLHEAYDGFVEDVHVYEKALQPFNLGMVVYYLEIIFFL